MTHNTYCIIDYYHYSFLIATYCESYSDWSGQDCRCFG